MSFNRMGVMYVNEIIVALITGGLTFAGVIITNLTNGKRTEASIRTAQAVTDTKIEELTREVREHNNFAKRMPVVENKIENIEKDISELKEYHK